ncbi:FAD-dependent oxidoreductase, partial [Mycobacterium ulcerans]
VTGQLARVQARRWAPTAFLQGIQRAIHAAIVAVAVTGGPPQPPPVVRLVSRSVPVRRIMGYLVAIGPLPEHAPKYPRRAR